MCPKLVEFLLENPFDLDPDPEQVTVSNRFLDELPVRTPAADDPAPRIQDIETHPVRMWIKRATPDTAAGKHGPIRP